MIEVYKITEVVNAEFVTHQIPQQ